MVIKFNFYKNSKKKAMTLVALLITMSVTCILLGMFVPIFVQGMVNIANGKSFDGSVNLNRRNGFFMCYYNSNGQLTQTRADVAPNGKDVEVITAIAPAEGCVFDIPTWPDAFKVTLVGGGGAGSVGDFSLFDEVIPDHVLVVKPEISGDVVKYNFNVDESNVFMLEEFLKKNVVCLATNKGIRLDNISACAQVGSNCSLQIDKLNKRLVYTANGKENTAQISGGTVYPVGELTVLPDFVGVCPEPKFFISLASSVQGIELGKSISFLNYQSGLQVSIPKGGQRGEKSENILPFFIENQNGQLVIPRANIGLGGELGVDSGTGGTTRLEVPGDKVIEAKGGEVGAIQTHRYYDDDGDNSISVVSFQGENGTIDRFIPQPLKITDLRRGNGAIDENTDAIDATYCGAGGGSGAIWLDNYNSAVFGDDPCLYSRIRMSVDGHVYELNCSPKSKSDFTDAGIIDSYMVRSNGGKGAPGAILVAW